MKNPCDGCENQGLCTPFDELYCCEICWVYELKYCGDDCSYERQEGENNMKVYGSEFTDAQEERIDVVENAAYEFALILTELLPEDEDDDEEKCLPWDMEFIGEIADTATEILEGCGYRVRYPFHTEDEEGRDIICDYLDEE